MYGSAAKAKQYPIPSVPKFSLSYVDHSYEVPETTISHTDPYTGKVTTETQPGYHVKNYTIDVIIENQNLPATIEGNQLVMKYTVQIKATMKMTFRFKQTHLKLT
jgi:hypothetical protein